MKVERNLTITLILTEDEAKQVYKHLHPKYLPNDCDLIKDGIVKALGYKPLDD